MHLTSHSEKRVQEQDNMGLGQEVAQILTIKQKQGRSDNFQHHYDQPRDYHVPVHDEGDAEVCGDESTAPLSVSGARLLPSGVHAHVLLRAPWGRVSMPLAGTREGLALAQRMGRILCWLGAFELDMLPLLHPSLSSTPQPWPHLWPPKPHLLK